MQSDELVLFVIELNRNQAMINTKFIKMSLDGSVHAPTISFVASVVNISMQLNVASLYEKQSNKKLLFNPHPNLYAATVIQNISSKKL